MAHEKHLEPKYDSTLTAESIVRFSHAGLMHPNLIVETDSTYIEKISVI